MYKLTIVVDKEFLESETTVYPVTIDPTVSMAATNMSDAPVFSGYPTRNYYTNEYNMVGIITARHIKKRSVTLS